MSNDRTSITAEKRTMALPQGDVGLLGTSVAQGLLQSTELARVAYVAADGTPRVFPMLFHWDGVDIVLCTFAGARKIEALRARPRVAVRPDWVGVLDFRTRLPGGASPQEFAERDRS